MLAALEQAAKAAAAAGIVFGGMGIGKLADLNPKEPRREVISVQIWLLGKRWIVTVVGRTYPVKDILKAAGYRWVSHQWELPFQFEETQESIVEAFQNACEAAIAVKQGVVDKAVA